MPDKFTDVEKAKEYMKQIRAHAFVDIEKMDHKTLLILANANWRMLGDEHIKEVELPDA
jgi:hypothetical protein